MSMSKRVRNPPGFYASLFDDFRDLDRFSKYRPNAKPTLMGVYEVERVVAKRIQRGKVEYFIKWKNYFPEENTWEPAMNEELISAFEDRVVDPLRTDECRERLALLFERGLKTSLACNETITMRHDVLRALFPGLPTDLQGTPYLAGEEELIKAGFEPYLKKCFIVTGGVCRFNTPVMSCIKLHLGKSLSFRNDQGLKSPSRPVEKVQIKFTKSHFTGNLQ